MYLFILLFTVYLIVALTRRECASAAGLRFRFFLRSLQNGCVYLFFLYKKSAALNTCVSEMRLIKFDELKKNVLTLYLAFCVVPVRYLPRARRSPQDANSG